MASTLQISAGLDTSRIYSQIEDVQRRLNSKKINIQINDRASSALGNITGKTTQFNEALDAATARVVAFGVAAGAFNLVRKGVEELLRATVEVESALTRININLNESSEGLKQFSKNIFDIARNTGQTFETAAKAAEELARQGLSAEETTSRLKDALILSRLAAIDSDEAVKSLTASINSFSREALSSSEILNKLAAVDAKFAVSTGDLAAAVSRVGSSASDAGVKFDELLAIVTSVQQTTARGGAVIGNAFKTIFTRIERSSTLNDLEALGIGVRDLEGKTLPAIQILQNLAKTYDTLSQAQRSAVAEQVGGVFQINILKAALGDLGKEYSVYQRALETASGASDEATRKNEALNKTLASSFNELRQSLTQLFAEFGKVNLNPVLKAISDGLTGIAKFLSGSDVGKDAGKSLGENILQGVGNVLTGPGVVALAAIIQSVMSTLIRKVGAEFGQAVSASLLGSGALTGIGQAGKISQVRRVVPRAASGLLPSIMGESAAISAGVGGASPSAKPVVIPNFNFGGGKRGAVVANTNEYMVPNYAGSGGSAIFNKNMVSAYGLPSNAQRLAQGYVPNFANIKSRKTFDITDNIRVMETENGSNVNYYLDKLTGKINIDTLNSKKRGEAFSLFNSLAKRAKKIGTPIYSAVLEPQPRQISKDASNFENLSTIFPQLRYRDQSGLKTRGVFGDDAADKIRNFRSLSALKSMVNSMRPGDFTKKLVNNNISLSDIETSFAAGGYIPNFAGSQANYFRKYFGLSGSPLASAVSREIDAGVSPGNIYIDADKRIASRGNPLGLLVANRRDEPSGGFQGVNRILSQGGNPKMAGLAKGHVPNFATINPKSLFGTEFSRKDFSSRGFFIPEIQLKQLNDLFLTIKTTSGKGFENALKSIKQIEKELPKQAAGFVRGRVLGVYKTRSSIPDRKYESFPNFPSGVVGTVEDDERVRKFQEESERAAKKTYDIKKDAAARNERAAFLRQSRREKEAGKQQRRANALLGLSIVSSFAGPTIEGAIAGNAKTGEGRAIVGGFAGGALQGAGIGAIFGPQGAALGATVGALVGTFSKLKKSAEDFDEELAKTTSKQVKSANAAAEYVQIEEELNSATSRGEKGAIIKRLQDRLNKSLTNVDGDTARKLSSAKTPEEKREILRQVDNSLANQITKDEAKSALFRVSNPGIFSSIAPDFSGKKSAGAVEAGLQIAKNEESRKALLALTRQDKAFLINEIGKGLYGKITASQVGGEVPSPIQLAQQINDAERIGRLQSIVDEVGKTDETFRGQKVTEDTYASLVDALTAATAKSVQLEQRLNESNEIQKENQAYFSKLGIIANFLQTQFQTREIVKQGFQERRGTFEQTRLSLLQPTLTSTDFAKIKLESEIGAENERAAVARDTLRGEFSGKIRSAFLASGGQLGERGEEAFAKNNVDAIAKIISGTDASKAREILAQYYSEIKKGEQTTKEAISTIEQRNALEIVTNTIQRRRGAYLNTQTLGGTPAFQNLSSINKAIAENSGDYNLRRIQKNEALIGVGGDIKSASGEILTPEFKRVYESAIFNKQKDTVLSRSAGLLSSIFPSDSSNFLTERGTPFEGKYYKERFKTAIRYSENPEQKALLKEGLAQLNDQLDRPKGKEEDSVLNKFKSQLEDQKKNIELLGKTTVSISTMIDGTVNVISDSLSEGQTKKIGSMINDAVRTVLDKTYSTIETKIAQINGAPLPPSSK